MGIFEGIDWVGGVIVPLIETIVVLSFVLFLSYVVTRAIIITWNKSTKWFVKYSIKKTAYPIETIQWIINSIEKGMSYYDVKKKLLLSMKDNAVDMDRVNEVLWIYTKTLREMQGGRKDNGRFKDCNSPIKSTTAKLPE